MFRLKLFMLFTCFLSIFALSFVSGSFAAPIIIDHTALDRFSSLSDNTIDSIQANIRWHYAHTSHGGQLTTGLGRLESSDSKYDVTRKSRDLPTIADSLNIFDGQEHDTYISPDEYWETPTGINYTQSVLDNYSTINVSMWSWCTQPNSYSHEKMQQYLDQMAAFEAQNPDVTFVYMTGTAEYSGAAGYNRHLRNEQIRAWVQNSQNRVLFDFADLDSWWKNTNGTWEQATYDHNGTSVPVEHSHYKTGTPRSGHTSVENCDNKGKAVWVMMADIEAANAVPIPAGIVLLGSGLIGLLGFRRIKKK